MKYQVRAGVLVPFVQKYYKLLILAVVGLFMASIATMTLSASAVTTTVYDAVPNTLPSNYPSLGYQATGTSEFGDLIEFAGTDRNLVSATVTMSSWACETGQWQDGDCFTTPGATFSHPVTLNLYNVDGGSVGTLISSVTQDFDIPFRPSVDPACPDYPGKPFPTQWRDGEGTCVTGFANNIVFDLAGVTVPDQVVYGVAFNTQSYGELPIGAGGPYNALNVALEDSSVMPTVGNNVLQNEFYWNGSMQDFGPTWAPYTVAIQFDAEVTPPVLEYSVNGGGHILEGEGKRKDKKDISFGVDVKQYNTGVMGEATVRFHNVSDDELDKTTFHSSEITSFNYFEGNSNCNAAMNFTAVGTWNGQDATLIMRAGDNEDTVRFTLSSEGKTYDSRSSNDFPKSANCRGDNRTVLDKGNVTISKYE